MKNNEIVVEFIGLLLSCSPEVYEKIKLVILAGERDPSMKRWYRAVFKSVDKHRTKLIAMEHSC